MLLFLELDFHKHNIYVKLEFHDFEFQNSGRLLNILQTMVEHQLFRQKMVFGYFGS